MSVIRKDAKGLYVITNGGTYRPEVTQYTFPLWCDELPSRATQGGMGTFLMIGESWPTKATEGMFAKVRHISQTSKARVQIMLDGVVRKETWSWHEESPEMRKFKL